MTDDQPIVLRAKHIRKAGYCHSGSERALRRFGLDPVDFYQNGCPISHFEGTQNPLIKHCIQVAIEDHESRKRHGKK